jgi:MoxR-like ATPase
LIVRSLAEALNLSFNRVQFTVDLMPADITGTRIINESVDGRREFVFVPDPIFAHLVLGDEINRATEDPVGAARGDGGAAGDGRRISHRLNRRSSCSPP